MAGSAAVPGVDPSGVSTPEELAACLDGLRRRRGLSYEEALSKCRPTVLVFAWRAVRLPRRWLDTA